MAETVGAASSHTKSGARTAPYVMLALASIGLAAAAYVGIGSYAGHELWCPVIDGCNTVVNSPYSRVFGVPMSFFGFVYYLYMFALAARLAYEPFSMSVRFRAVLYSAMGAVSSVYFIYLQQSYIRAICSYCLIAAAVSFLLLMVALWHYFAFRHLAALGPASPERSSNA
jgi:uncharacterized membrane protein